MTAGRENDLDRGGGPGRGRRVVVRGVPRKEVDEGLIIQALLMIAKDLERGEDVAGQDAPSES